MEKRIGGMDEEVAEVVGVWQAEVWQQAVYAGATPLFYMSCLLGSYALRVGYPMSDTALMRASESCLPRT